MAQPKWDATQLAVLDAAVTCAEQVGFGAMTTRRVAELAGVNEVSLARVMGPPDCQRDGTTVARY